MDRKEAKIRLQILLTNRCSTCRYGDKKCTQDCEFEQAVNMAIESLSANYTTKKPNDEVEQGNDIIDTPTDLISRADAIEELGEYFDHLKRIDKRGIKRIEPISLDCKGIINELPSADRPSGEWIIASEELPQKVGSYIVTCIDEDGQVYVDYDFWTVLDEFKYNRSKVTAWTPFPKPYCGAKMGSDTR